MRRTILLAATLAAPALCQQAPDFEREVWPIFESRCIECHRAPWIDDQGRAKKPKGGLRFDGKAHILRGSDAGSIIEKGDPDDSVLIERLELDADDPDVMPAEGEKLDDAQIAILRRWIAAGATFGDWTGATAVGGPNRAAEAARDQRRIAVYRALAEGLIAPSDSTLEKAVGDSGQISAVLGSGPLYRVQFKSHELETDDDAIAELARIARNIAELDLARTVIGDRALRDVGRMPNLVRLDLSRTEIGDTGVRSLASLPELRVLNLFATGVTDRAVADLAKIEKLEKVHVWRTGITEKGLAKLRAARPELEIVGAPVLATPPEDGPTTGGRRRR